MESRFLDKCILCRRDYLEFQMEIHKQAHRGFIGSNKNSERMFIMGVVMQILLGKYIQV